MLLWVLLSLAWPELCTAQTTAPEWLANGVIYQIYPRSFQDGCSPHCTGTGSLDGIADRMGYLSDLGISCIWISPIYASPMRDFGYDISNFTAIASIFGDMSAFDRVMNAANTYGIKVLLDLVPNHSSDQHPWFIESRSSLSSPKRDWYIWRNGINCADNPDGTRQCDPPTNWRSIFCQGSASCSAWQYDNTTRQYYYHQFLIQQPDLNWRNADLQAAMYNVMRFWLDKGVYGFRVDAFAYLYETVDLVDEPVRYPPESGYRAVIPTRTENVAPLRETVANLSRVVKAFGADRVLVGEIYADPPVVNESTVNSFYGTPTNPGLDMPFNFDLITAFQSRTSEPAIGTASPFDPSTAGATLLAELQRYYTTLPSRAQPNFVLGNHDNPRIASRIGVDVARLAAVLLLTLKGTPTMYYGDELGMTDVTVPPSRRQDPANPSRDPERAPMPWTDRPPNAGFTGDSTQPWLPVWPDYPDKSATAQATDSCSYLHMYRSLLRLRAAEPALHRGNITFIEPGTGSLNDGGALIYSREYEATAPWRSFTVAINFGNAQARINAALPANSKTVRVEWSSSGKVDFANVVGGPARRDVTLGPVQALIFSHAVEGTVPSPLGPQCGAQGQDQLAGASSSSSGNVALGVIGILSLIAAVIIVAAHGRRRCRSRRPQQPYMELEMKASPNAFAFRDEEDDSVDA